MKNSRSLQEVLFVAHFRGFQPLTVLDLADWRASVAGCYPIFQQQPEWTPIVWPNTPNNVNPQFFSIPLNPIQPRVVGLTDDQRWSVVLQRDRVAISWRRIEQVGHEVGYPGFDSVLDRAISFIESFQVWWASRMNSPAAFDGVELNYFNAFPMSVGARTFRLSEIFTFLTAGGNRKVANPSYSWWENIDPPLSQAIVQCTATVGSTLDGQNAALFNFMGMSRLEEQGSTEGIATVYKHLHSAIREAYLSAINTDVTGSTL